MAILVIAISFLAVACGKLPQVPEDPTTPPIPNPTPTPAPPAPINSAILLGVSYIDPVGGSKVEVGNGATVPFPTEVHSLWMVTFESTDIRILTGFTSGGVGYSLDGGHIGKDVGAGPNDSRILDVTWPEYKPCKHNVAGPDTCTEMTDGIAVHFSRITNGVGVGDTSVAFMLHWKSL